MSTLARALLPALLLALLPGLLASQVTTAEVHGRILRDDGSPIAGARVRVLNTSTGFDWHFETRANGAYHFQNVAVGGPYRIEAQALGYLPAARADVTLTLGQRQDVELVLRDAAIRLAAVEVTAASDPVLNSGRTGPEETISRDRIAGLPNPGRDFLALTTLSPQTAISVSSGVAPTGGIAIAGQNRLYNAFQIDGGVNHDLYSGRLPGRETLPRPISLEALEEIHVMPAPFDVRHGGFAGGLVNAVTRSGTNAWHGSVFSYLSDAALVGLNETDTPVGPFTTWQYGGTVGGPIVRDRAQFFASVDARHEVVPDPGPLIADTAGGADMARIGISYASALRFQDILRRTYGLEPGTLGPVAGQVRAQDVFGKLTLQTGTNSHLELSHHHTQGDRWGFILRTKGFYFPSANSQRNPSIADASRLIWTSLVGFGWSNEVIASWLRLDDRCLPGADYPAITVITPPSGMLTVGAQGGCPSNPINAVAQDALELTENVTGAFAGGTHIVTLGAHGEVLRFRDNWLQASSGAWTFANLDSLETRHPSRYARTLPGPERTGGLDFQARQVGAYAQDRWSLTPRLTVTLGFRLDVHMMPDAVVTNSALRDSLGIDTGRLPSGRPLWSPRLGINYELGGARRTYLRGGIGLFSGRPPYTWLGNAYRDNGLTELSLDCRLAAAPIRFDPANQPATCADGSGAVPRFSFFDPGVTFPQNLKLALGVDHQLPGGLAGTVDVVYNRAAHQLHLTDANLLPPTGVARGEGDRPLYGTFAANGLARPARRDTLLGQVVRVGDSNGDNALSVTLQLRRRFGERMETSAFYGYTRARDRMSLVNPGARNNLANTPLTATLDARELRPSYFEVPHRVQVSAALRLPFQTSLSLLYSAAAGTPYTYVVVGDANADGIGGTAGQQNDAVYVPRDSLDISLVDPATWRALNAVIDSEPCLREQRGRVLPRNSCRNPWFGTLNVRATKDFLTGAGHRVQLATDVYNVLNVFDRRWGQSRVTAPDPWWQLLTFQRYDSSRERGVYQPFLRGVRRIQDLASRWKAEVSMRYVF